MNMAMKRLHDARTTAELILDQITRFPETHDQEWFELRTRCGTKRCVAGWAVHLNGYNIDEASGCLIVGSRKDVDVVAAELLGLDYNQSEWLFYETTNAEAVNAVRLLAAGGDLVAPEHPDPGEFDY